MIELIWSLLNIIILLFFIYLFFGFLFQGKKIFQGKFKNLSIIILILGVVQIISATRNDEHKNSIEFRNQVEHNYPITTKNVILENNLTKNYKLSIVYSRENETHFPKKGTISMTGLTSGFDLELISLYNDNDVFYVTAIQNWSLFGIQIYRQEKNFEGRIEN